MSRQILKHLVSPEGRVYGTEDFRRHSFVCSKYLLSLIARLRGWGPEACGARVDRRLRLETRGLQHRTRGEPRMQEVGCISSPGDLLLRPTVCNQTRNPWLKALMELKGEAERLGTGGLWCQGGPETEAGDQGPAAPDQRLKGEAERLGTGGLWCQGGPETEAGDQGPAAPDQRVTITTLI
ncbi:unnamed protein product [Boreogadus saida]